MKIQIGDGITWVDLTPVSGAIKLMSDISLVAAKSDGDVTENANFLVIGSSEITTTKPALERLFEQASARVTMPHLSRVFVRQQADYDVTWWVSELIAGIALIDFSTGWHRVARAKLNVAWTRRAYWRAEAETTLVSSLSLRGTYDGSGSNIALLGQNNASAYSPLRLALVNATAATLSRIYAGLYRARTVISAATLGAANVLEAESGTVLGGTGTTTALGGASNGNYRAFSWSGSAVQSLLSWSLISAQLNLLGGRAWKPFVRITALPVGVTRLGLTLKSGTLTLAQTEMKAVAGASLLELPGIYMPPYVDLGGLGLAPLTLELAAQGAGSNTLNVDCLHLLPTDGYRTYVAGSGAGLAAGVTLVDKPHDNAVGVSSGGLLSTFAVSGEPFEVGAGDYAALITLVANTVDVSPAAAAALTLSAYVQEQRRSGA